MPSNKPSKIAECVKEAGGDAASGIVLYRLKLWVKLSKDSHPYDTLQNWSDDTGLALSTYKRALGRLAKLGLVKKTAGYNKRRRTRVTYLRYIGQLQNLDSSKPNMVSLNDQIDPINQPKLNSLYIEEQGGQYMEDYKESSPSGSKKVSPKNELLEQGKPMQSIFGQSEYTVSDIAAIWKQEHTEAYPGELQGTWSQKLLGKVKHVLTEKVPKNHQEFVDGMRFAIHNWDSFSSYLEAKTTAFDLPLKPALEPVLKDAHEVVNFWRQHIKEISQSTTADSGKSEYLGDL